MIVNNEIRMWKEAVILFWVTVPNFAWKKPKKYT